MDCNIACSWKGRPVRWKLWVVCVAGNLVWVYELQPHTRGGSIDRSRNQTRRVFGICMTLLKIFRSGLWVRLGRVIFISSCMGHFTLIRLNLWVFFYLGLGSKSQVSMMMGIINWKMKHSFIYIYISILLVVDIPAGSVDATHLRAKLTVFFLPQGELKSDGWWHAMKASSS